MEWEFLGEREFLGCLTLIIRINGRTYEYKIPGPYVREQFMRKWKYNKGKALAYLKRMEVR
jgi:hypothetical protein